MLLNEKYKVVFEDVNNVVLQEKREAPVKDSEGNPTGDVKVSWVTVAYCINIAGALKVVVDREINGSGVETLKQFTAMYKDLREYIEEITGNMQQEILSEAKEKSKIILGNAKVAAGETKKKRGKK